MCKDGMLDQLSLVWAWEQQGWHPFVKPFPAVCKRSRPRQHSTLITKTYSVVVAAYLSTGMSRLRSRRAKARQSSSGL